MHVTQPAACVFALLACTAAASDAPLADAAEQADRSAGLALLETGASVDAAQADGMTALHMAAYHDDAQAVKRLLDAGADADAANRYGLTPLSLACTNGNGEIVAALLKAGADPNKSLPGGETPLMTAARTGRLEPVKALIAHSADVNAKERRGQTAIMWAAAEGHAEVVEALIEAGADFRTPLPSGFTPLFFAAREGRAEVIRVLLAAGADVNEAMRPEKSPSRGPDKGSSPLILAVENGHLELAAELLERGADPNDQRSGYTPLHVLTWVRKPKRGDDEDGNPPPIGSGNVTSLQLVRTLATRGADVNARLEKGPSGGGKLGRKGATPFLLACETADVPLMRLLVELGADPLLPNAENSTPLTAAAGLGTPATGDEAASESEALEAVALALELGGDVNSVDDNGETAMHGAAYKNAPTIVQFLAGHGANVEVWNRKNKYGWTPTAIAEGHRHGNFKPSPETIAALHEALLAAGVTPPDPAPVTVRKAY